MRQFSREIVGLVGKRALLSCGHLGDYAQLMAIGGFQFCAVCKFRSGALSKDVRAEHGGTRSKAREAIPPDGRHPAHVEEVTRH